MVEKKRKKMFALTTRAKARQCDSKPAADVGSAKSLAYVIVVVGLTVAVTCVYVIFRAAPSPSSDSKTHSASTAEASSERVGLNAGLSSLIEPFVDTSAEPCRDFYAFACGAYASPSAQTITQMQDEMYDALPRALSTTTYPERGQSAAQKAAALYHSCLRVQAGELDESTTLRQFVQSVGLSVPGYARAEALDRVLLLFFKYKLLTLLGLSLEDSQLYKGAREIKVTLNANQLVWFRQRSSNVLTNKFYAPHTDALGVLNDGDEALRIAVQITESENTAIGLLTKGTLQKANSLVFSTVDGIGIYTPTIRPGRWEGLIAAHSNNVYRKEHKIQISVSALSYFDKIYSNLGEARTSLLVAWELVRTLVPLSSSELAEHVRNFPFICLRSVIRAMEVPLLSHYLFRAVPASTVDSAKKMLWRIRKSVIEEIRRASWLDDVTKATALDKMRTLQAHVGYPKFFANDEELDQVYSRYPDVSFRFLEAWLYAMKLTIEWELRNTSSFKFSLRATNAAYFPMRNALMLPATMLRPPVFSPGAPMAYNYGGLGSVIGHEMTHAFDVEGRLWDSDGQWRDWWSKSSRLFYDDKLLCLRRSHGTSRETADSENMADFAGVVSALNAYRGLLRESAEHLAELRYNAQQLFFISSCVKWCAANGSASFTNYASWRDRCVIPLKNMEAFASAFGCSQVSRMSQSSRCSFW
ncbi:neprilysin-1-like [Dermacentor andersoni]|uniref:neprilysin-1-like n=1 Tax=Dermacentor andersoni TaxID=34620 RepID=UPI0021556412|nr:neprilysin-1-like [Dermacentor andersoni]